MKKLEAKKARLEKQIKEKGYNAEIWGQLNVLNHSIEVTQNRIEGKFKSVVEFTEIPRP